MDSDVRNEYFALKEVITDNLYENAIKNIELNKDIVKFPAGQNGIYALVTNIFKRDNNIIIYGIYKNQFGELETLSNVFRPGEVIYRKREDIINPYIKDEVIVPSAGILITSTTNMNQTFVKDIIRKGDLVNGNLVLGIYPGYLYVETPRKTEEKNFYYKIKSITSSKALEELDLEKKINPNHFITINNGDDLTTGDYFLYSTENKKFYKKVLYTDKDNVYS
jgi:hypothetical protein